MYRDLEARVAQITQQLAAARSGAGTARRGRTNMLVDTRQQLIEARDSAQQEATETHQQIAALRLETGRRWSRI
jgi:hypothetical protein